MRIRIEPYKPGSRSAKALSRRCGILRTKTGRTYRPTDTIINWGNSERRFQHGIYINDPASVSKASCKLTAYRAMDQAGDVPIPDYTTELATAQEWLGEGYTVVVRNVLRGHGGLGIHIVEPGGTLPPAPLYVEYIKKAQEYRIHVVRGQIIDIQQKRRCRGVPDEQVNYQVRNSHFGWVFCRDNVVCPVAAQTASVAAVSALGLDFGAVDVGWNEHNGAATVYEVNTAPGLEGTTLEKYYRAIQTILPQINTGAYRRRRTATT